MAHEFIHRLRKGKFDPPVPRFDGKVTATASVLAVHSENSRALLKRPTSINSRYILVCLEPTE